MPLDRRHHQLFALRLSRTSHTGTGTVCTPEPLLADVPYLLRTATSSQYARPCLWYVLPELLLAPVTNLSVCGCVFVCIRLSHVECQQRKPRSALSALLDRPCSRNFRDECTKQTHMQYSILYSPKHHHVRQRRRRGGFDALPVRRTVPLAWHANASPHGSRGTYNALEHMS